MTTTKIHLNSMSFYAFHGVMPQERKVGNIFLLDITLTAPLSMAMETDCIDDTIHYGEIYETIKKEMLISSNLLEHVCGRIIKALRLRFPMIQTIEMKLSKQNPPFGGDLRSASIEVIDKKGSCDEK